MLTERTIPTHVGRTSLSVAILRSSADHPHARGENIRSVAYRPAYFRTIPTHVGRTFLLRPSAWVATDHPHARGRLLETLFRTISARTIPTHVGRTVSPEDFYAMLADHPHARGENALSFQMLLIKRGPSPRTWGDSGHVWLVRRAGRTIPTHVGRTARKVPAQEGLADHPHALGRNSTGVREKLPATGPSPRTWGEPQKILRS